MTDQTSRIIEDLLPGDPWDAADPAHDQAILEARSVLWSYLQAADLAHQGIQRTVNELHDLYDVEVVEGNTAAAEAAFTGLTVHLAALRELWKATR
jgi:hypothetical protein